MTPTWPEREETPEHDNLEEPGNAPGITVTGTQQERAWSDGLLPEVELVRPGLWAIPVPLATTRYVIVYAIELADGLALVDAGWDSEESWEVLTTGLTTIGGSIADVDTVLVTHLHRDHYGLAGRIREASGAVVTLHRADAEAVRRNMDEGDERVASARRLMAHCGVPSEDLDDVVAAFARWVPTRDMPDVVLEHGDRAPVKGIDLEVIWTPGHSPGHVCFYEARRRLLFSGDHVLPRITPNVSIHLDHKVNPLADFMSSLEAIRTVDAEEVLPAHEFRFTGLGARIDELVAHHESRLAEIEHHLDACGESSVWEIAQALHWSRPWSVLPKHVRRSAVGETLAHLVLLEHRSRVRRDPVASPWVFGRD